MQKQITDKRPRVHQFTAHNTVEFALDSYLINRILDINKPSGFKTFEAFKFTDEVADECARAIAYVVNSCTDFHISSFQAMQAIDDLMYIQKATYDPRHIKRMILHILIKFIYLQFGVLITFISSQEHLLKSTLSVTNFIYKFL